MNPDVYADPQVTPQLVPSRGRGRPTLYSPELTDEFCGLIVDGMTIDKACKEAGMPSKRTIQYWLKKYPEFRRKFEEAVHFRNQCWMDDTVDIADDTKSDVAITFTEDGQPVLRMVSENTRQRQPGPAITPSRSTRKSTIPSAPTLYQCEIEYQKRLLGRANGLDRSPDRARNSPNGEGG
jgi:hypothetical protein